MRRLALPLAAALLAALAAPLAPAPAAAADTVARMKETGELRLAVRRDARPLSFMEGDTAQGYSVEVCVEAAQRMMRDLGIEGLGFVYVPVGVDDRFAAVAEGRADLLCGAATVTMSRRETVDFSMATFVDGATVLAPTGTEVGDFADFEDQRIGVRAGTTTERALRNSLAELGVTAEVIPLPDHRDGLAGLLEGRLDFYFGDQSILLALATDPSAAGKIAMAQELLTVETHALALPWSDNAFRLAVDRALASMYRDGSMERIFARHFPGSRPGIALRALHLLSAIPE